MSGQPSPRPSRPTANGGRARNGGRRPRTGFLELGIGQGAPPIEVHAGHCYAIGKRRRVTDRAQTLAVLDAGTRACTHCRPDTDRLVSRRSGWSAWRRSPTRISGESHVDASGWGHLLPAGCVAV
ncbi:DUF6233 domain-containing protein [Streptomyces brevispora]|uniref:DUF6233 domain-containing protein n=1 Tax=Streptomyces brevispora TaxID=887462 RepID=UPI002E3026FD|nr:DUF6233 domain-containing protein [Streptomyces brevispora]